MPDHQSRPSQVSHLTMRKPFDGEQALAIDLLIAYLRAVKEDDWFPFIPADCVEWGEKSKDIPASLHAMCGLVPEKVLRGFYLLLDEGYLKKGDEFQLKGTKLFYDRLGVKPPPEV